MSIQWTFVVSPTGQKVPRDLKNCSYLLYIPFYGQFAIMHVFASLGRKKVL